MTAIVVAWNSAPDLEVCLPSVPDGTSVVVVDNSSTDDSVSVATTHGACVIRLPANVGFAAAFNVALERVETPYTLLLNPDVTIVGAALERCVEELERSTDVGIVGPNTRLPDGRPEPPAARRDRTAAQIAIESLGLVHVSRRMDVQMVHDRSADRDVDAVNGAFMLARTDLLRSLGGLDETVFMYLEDQELCRRVRDAGYRVRFLHDAHVVHGNGTSTARGDEQQQARAYLHRLDADLEFLRRYGRRGEVTLAIAAFVLRSAIGLLLSLRGGRRRLRYRLALAFALRQLNGRHPPPPV